MRQQQLPFLCDCYFDDVWFGCYIVELVTKGVKVVRSEAWPIVGNDFLSDTLPVKGFFSV